MMVNIIKRAKEIKADSPSATLNIFLKEDYKQHGIQKFLTEFCNLDDYDFLNALKYWMNHPDTVLSYLCKGLINRNILKVKYFSRPVPEDLLNKKKDEVCKQLTISLQEASYLTFTGETENKTYNTLDEHINILYKDGTVKDISKVDNALINQSLFGTVKKFYICYVR
jgi:hypothetical protein